MAKMSLFPHLSNRMDGENLDIVMTTLGVTQATLARRLGVDRKTVSRWLADESPVPGSVALLMSVAFVTQSYLSHHWDIGGHSVDHLDHGKPLDTLSDMAADKRNREAWRRKQEERS